MQSTVFNREAAKNSLGCIFIRPSTCKWSTKMSVNQTSGKVPETGVRTTQAHADGFQRGTPSAAGVDAAAIEAFLDEVEAAGLDIHSLMLHRANCIVAEAWHWPYHADDPRIMHSLAKSFTACAIGLAIEEGHFKLTDKVVSFFPNYLPTTISPELAAMTVEDLLTMRIGHGEETSGSIWRGIDTSWIREFFKIPIVHQPGTVYLYTSAASYMLGAVLYKTTGQTLHAYLTPRLFEPLGIQGTHWDIGTDGFNPGGNGLSCKTSDIVKLGVLHAQRGMWNGKQILPEAWVTTATRRHGGNDYGYHWIATERGDFRALGVFVQMVQVFPEHDATLAITAGIQSSTQLLPILYRHFPAAFREGLLQNAAADAKLKARLQAYNAPRLLQSEPSPWPDKISGCTFAVAPNDLRINALRFDFGGSTCTLHLIDNDGVHDITMGMNSWRETHASLPGRELHHGYKLDNARIIAGAYWRAADTLEMIWIFADTAFRDTIICHFKDASVTFERSVNVNSDMLQHPVIIGTVTER